MKTYDLWPKGKYLTLTLANIKGFASELGVTPANILYCEKKRGLHLEENLCMMANAANLCHRL